MVDTHLARHAMPLEQRINVIAIPSGWSAIARNLARSKGRTAQGWKCVTLGLRPQ